MKIVPTVTEKNFKRKFGSINFKNFGEQKKSRRTNFKNLGERFLILTNVRDGEKVNSTIDLEHF